MKYLVFLDIIYRTASNSSYVAGGYWPLWEDYRRSLQGKRGRSKLND